MDGWIWLLLRAGDVQFEGARKNNKLYQAPPLCITIYLCKEPSRCVERLKRGLKLSNEKSPGLSRRDQLMCGYWLFW